MTWLRELDCPECGEPCGALAAREPTDDTPYPHWEHGDEADCAECGVRLVVWADGEEAYLETIS